MDYPKPIRDLIDSFSRLPGIGKKTAERLALYSFTDLDEDEAKKFSDALLSVKNDLYKCPKCHNLAEHEGLCDICEDEKRDKKTIMVVENIKDVFIMERMDNYKGLYHVLDGAINFASGIGVDDINIKDLLSRIKEEDIKEIILATNATTDGETTARYIKALVETEKLDVSITRIAHGLPFGGDISYADEMTLLKAIEGRRNY